MYAPLIILLTLSFLMMVLYNLLPAKSRFGSSLFPVLQLMGSPPPVSGTSPATTDSADCGDERHQPRPLPRAKVYGNRRARALSVGARQNNPPPGVERARWFILFNTLVVLLVAAFLAEKRDGQTGA